MKIKQQKRFINVYILNYTVPPNRAVPAAAGQFTSRLPVRGMLLTIPPYDTELNSSGEIRSSSDQDTSPRPPTNTTLVVISRITGRARPFVCLFVCLSVLYGLLIRKKKRREDNIVVNIIRAGMKGVPVVAQRVTIVGRQKPAENDAYLEYMFTYCWRVARWPPAGSPSDNVTRCTLCAVQRAGRGYALCSGT